MAPRLQSQNVYRVPSASRLYNNANNVRSVPHSPNITYFPQAVNILFIEKTSDSKGSSSAPILTFEQPPVEEGLSWKVDFMYGFDILPEIRVSGAVVLIKPDFRRNASTNAFTLFSTSKGYRGHLD
jgi:hypothetical protein